MKALLCALAVLASPAFAAPPAIPFGVFDFNLRGKDPAAQIHSLDGLGFDGIAMQLQNAAQLDRLAAFLAAKPDLRLFAGYIVIDHRKPDTPSAAHIEEVAKALAARGAKLWLILTGPKGSEDKVLQIICDVADAAAREKVGVSLYPHDNSAMESAEEALVFLNKANRPNLTLTVHLCHEIRAGNGARLGEVVAAVRPHLDLATISGSNTEVVDNSQDWSDAIKPLGEGDFDASKFLRALLDNDFHGPVILHTFGLGKFPADHYRRSAEEWRKMLAEVSKPNP